MNQLSALAKLFLLLTMFPWIIHTSDLNSDKSALLAFSNAVTRTQKLNWNPTTQICTSWIGITCTEDRTRVLGIHLPNMRLYGSIPPNTIGKLNALTVLSLKSNYFHGNLPSDIFSIPSLQSLYLQKNNFSGEIPNPIDIPRLVLLNLSFNSLNGEIPFLLQKFPVSSFIGNARLCGPLMAHCTMTTEASSPAVPVRKSAKTSRKLGFLAIIGMIIGGTFLLVILVLAVFLKKKVRVWDSVIKANNGGKSENFGSGVQGGEKIKLAIFEGCSFNFDFEDILRASAEVLGKGRLGTSYKATLDEATTIVVKRLNKQGFGKKEFEQHIEVVNRLSRHPNVVRMIAYCCCKDEKLLVYKYLPDSLAAALHGNIGEVVRIPLDWDSRLTIALGAARGIAGTSTKWCYSALVIVFLVWFFILLSEWCVWVPLSSFQLATSSIDFSKLINSQNNFLIN